MNPRYAAIVPCYNVEEACRKVVEQTLRQVPLCIAVDDGSTDHTYSVLESMLLSGLKVLRHSKNLGKGAALITGFRDVLELDSQFDAVIALDADGQHDPALISNFVAAFEQEKSDLIYGNRMTDLRGMPLHRQWLNALSNKLVSKICKMRIYDSQCGYRLYSRRLLELLLNELTSARYELETEILIRTCHKKLKIAAIPIPTVYSPETSALSHHSLTDVIRIGKLLVKLRR